MSAVAERARAARLLDLVGGNWTTQAIGAAVTLGIVDALAVASMDAAALADRTGCDAAALRRLLRALTTIGVCELGADSRYTLTPMGSLLREDAPFSVRGWAQWCSGPQWALWGGLAESVRTGRSARALAGGSPGYAHLDADAVAAAGFHQAMSGLTRRIGAAVAKAVDWRGVRRVIDIGGGYGDLLAELLQAQPHLHGTLFDLPHATQGATQRFERLGLAARCDVASGSFFESLPHAGDVYALKSILHNWSDADVLRILECCRAVMRPKARLLVIERVLPERPRGGLRQRAILRSDLNMLVSLGGRERSRREFARLAHQAGFTAPSLAGVAFDYSILQLQPLQSSNASCDPPGRGTRARSHGRRSAPRPPGQ